MSDSGFAGERVTPAVPDDPDFVRAAEDVALRILRGAAQSQRSLQQRLQRRGFTEQAALAATASMVALGYVDDAVLAGSLAARSRRTGHGRLHAAAQLRARGIGDEDVAGTLAVLDSDAERAGALALGRRLQHRGGGSEDVTGERRRLFAQLQRRGFDSETVHWVLRQLEAELATEPAD